MNGRDAEDVLNASLLLDGEGRILEGNRDAEVFLGRPLEEVRKKPLSEANPSLYSVLKDLMAKTRRGRGVEDYALAYKVGKHLLRLSISVTPYPLEALDAPGILVTLSSIGGRQAAERSDMPPERPPALIVPESVEGFSELLNALAEPAFTLDLEANIVYANPAMCSLMAYPVEEIIGRPLSFFLVKEEAKKALGSLVEAACSAPWRGELDLRRADGATAYIAVTIDLLRTGEERADRLLGIGRDYGEEAKIRREREEELQRVWSLLERAGVALVCFTPDLRVTLLSHSAEDLLDTTRDRAIGTPLPELFPADTREEIVSILEQSLKGGEVKGAGVYIEEAAEGKRTLLIDVRPAVMAGGGIREYLMVLREATKEQSDAERAEVFLRESRFKTRFLELAVQNDRPEAFLGGCLDLIKEDFGCTAGAAFVLSEKKALLKAGRGLEEEVEKRIRSLRLRPGHARVCGELEKLAIEIRGGVPGKGWEELRLLIDEADILLPLLRDERWRGILVFPLRGEYIRGALALADCDPEKISEADAGLFPMMGESIASILEALGAKEAVTAAPGKGEAAPAHGEEEQAMFEKAREAKRIEPPEDNLALWGENEEERPSFSPRGVELPSFLQELKERVSGERGGGEVFLELEEDLPRVHTDPRLLREAILKLLDNALRYSPHGSPVILGAERWGDEVLLRVEDQGPGIPPEVVDEVMHTDLEDEDLEGEGYPGRDSGLFLCRRYLITLGGDLSIKGRPDEGTTVFVRLRVLPFVGEGL